MSSGQLKFVFPVFLAFLLSVISTFAMRGLARRLGFVANPKADRWHKKPTAMLGGVSIFLTVAICYLLFVPHNEKSLVVIAASSFLFLIGLIDDCFHIKPYQKIIGQVMGASFVVFYGLTLPWTSSITLNIIITIFWLVGITNALNLLDNMDGLAAGIATIASVVLAYTLAIHSNLPELLFISIFAAALLGFLVFNFNPASIFMGDCGSMFIGFFLASTVLLSASAGRSRSLFSVLAVPVLILFVPIFDTTFVTILRKLKGRAASQGGRDHTSHRLVALGLTERTAVLMLYGFAALSGALALLVGRLKTDQSIAAIIGFVVVLTLIGVYLAGVKVYEEDDPQTQTRNKALVSFLIDLSYKRRIFEVVLDVLLIILAYYCAYALFFGAMTDNEDWHLFLKTVPVLVFLKLAAFLWCGIYRGLWRYTGVDDLLVFAKALVLGSVFSVLAILALFRFQGFSRAVFVVDFLLLVVMLVASRLTFKLLRQLIPLRREREGRRILIYGAGDGGELLLRELRNNIELEYAPVGFVDDDPLKKGKVIHGLTVLGGNGSIPIICRKYKIEEILISSTKFPPERVSEVIQQCRDIGVVPRRMHMKIELLDETIE